MITEIETVLVVGATGTIGRQVIAEGERAGFAMRALVRRSDQARLFAPGTDVVVGDLTNPVSLASALDGIDAVVFTHGANGRPPGPEAVDYGAVRNVLLALGGRRVRIALMTTVGVTDRKGAHDWKRRGEHLVRASGLPYTIVRPGWFDYNAPHEQRLVMRQGDKCQSGTPQDGAVGRGQLAQVLLWSLKSNAALNKTFELSTEPGAQQAELDPVAMQLDTDRLRALDGIHDAANMALDAEPDRIRAALDAVHSAFASPGAQAQ
jgi:uncharacterized protein YbjT (DUF2867 family)